MRATDYERGWNHGSASVAICGLSKAVRNHVGTVGTMSTSVLYTDSEPYLVGESDALLYAASGGK